MKSQISKNYSNEKLNSTGNEIRSISTEQYPPNRQLRRALKKMSLKGKDLVIRGNRNGTLTY